MRAGVAQGGLISPVFFSLYVSDMAIIATFRKPTLLVSYLESYLNDLQRWLSEWIIAINVFRITAITSRVLDGASSSPDQ